MIWTVKFLSKWQGFAKLFNNSFSKMGTLLSEREVRIPQAANTKSSKFLATVWAVDFQQGKALSLSQGKANDDQDTFKILVWKMFGRVQRNLEVWTLVLASLLLFYPRIMLVRWETDHNMLSNFSKASHLLSSLTSFSVPGYIILYKNFPKFHLKTSDATKQLLRAPEVNFSNLHSNFSYTPPFSTPESP